MNLVFATLLAAAAAAAAPAKPAGAKKEKPPVSPQSILTQACGKELETHCPAVADTGQAMTDCLNGVKPKLSARCREALPKAETLLKAIGDASTLCLPDRAKFCPHLKTRDLPRGTGLRHKAFMGCMLAHKDELSPDCRDALIRSGEKL